MNEEITCWLFNANWAFEEMSQAAWNRQDILFDKNKRTESAVFWVYGGLPQVIVETQVSAVRAVEAGTTTVCRGPRHWFTSLRAMDSQASDQTDNLGKDGIAVWTGCDRVRITGVGGGVVDVWRKKVDYEVFHHIFKANQVFGCLQGIVWNRNGLYRSSKFKMCKTAVLPALLNTDSAPEKSAPVDGCSLSAEEFTRCRVQRRRYRPLDVLTVYRPSRRNPVADAYLLEELEKIATRLDILIMGDFNAPHIDWSSACAQSSDLAFDGCLPSTTLKLLLTQHVTFPTRVCKGRQANCLDLGVSDVAAGRAIVRQPTSSNPFCDSSVQNKLFSQLAFQFLSPTGPGQKVVMARAFPINLACGDRPTKDNRKAKHPGDAVRYINPEGVERMVEIPPEVEEAIAMPLPCNLQNSRDPIYLRDDNELAEDSNNCIEEEEMLKWSQCFSIFASSSDD
ncbi:unnamed protein product [Schistocephalus solidus]|uniref:Endo/exonuclease/phosphatase domain-containing protein n=1 Tax=Schistocephalus solidus TaxID=70667 RepID=A0A183TBV2_SCHSO|nr:unnamed protein product [Schistocephalus solidus]